MAKPEVKTDFGGRTRTNDYCMARYGPHAAGMDSSQLHGRDAVRWGIIGCGDVTEVKSGPGFQKATGSQLVAVMRRNGALAADYARRHGVARWYDDAAQLIADPEVDAVYVATPPDSHMQYALEALAAGKPAYVEKPMARHVPECDAMVAAAKKADQKLFVAYYRRCLPRFLKVKELFDRGALGTVTQVRYQWSAPFHRKDALMWRVNAERAGGGHFLDLASHGLDLLDFLFGSLTGVAGYAANRASPYDVEDVVTMSFRCGGEIPAVASWNAAGDHSVDELEIVGSEGVVRLSVFGNEQVHFGQGDTVELFDLPNPPHVAQPLIQTVVDDLLGCGTCPSTGESARRATAVMDAALSGYYGGRYDAFWARSETWPGRAKRSGGAR